VWMRAQSSSKTASLFRNNVWTMGCTWLPNLSTNSLAVIHPWRINNGTNRILYHDIAAQTITEPPVRFAVGTRHSRL
jgi:hypothetical protein